MNWTETTHVIPNGVQTESKMPNRHVEGVYPKYITKGNGGRVWGDDGKEYVDYTCSLGTNLLGHANIGVANAITTQIRNGTLFGLPHPDETTLAIKLVDYFPSGEMIRFLKTGSEACSAAVKIARACTGKRVILTCGYHGWHDWYNAITDRNRGSGAPGKPTVYEFKYNDYKALATLIEKHDVAAIIMEPYVYEEPKDNFLRKIRRVCDEKKIVLIFDEVVTAFRTKKGSAQAMFGIVPDLTVIGKGLGNGVPIAAVLGKREFMKTLEGDTFISSTFGGDLLGIAAGLSVMEQLDSAVIDHIWRMGDCLKSRFNDYSAGMDGVECIGYPCRTFFKFPTEEHKSLFWQECLKKGVFFGYAQFISFAHNRQDLDDTMMAMRHGIKMVKKHWDAPAVGLEGKVAEATIRLVENAAKSA